jgi:hypothetical protein
MTRIIPLLVVLILAGCAPRSGAFGRAGSAPPGFMVVAPGQSLSLRLEDGGTSSVIAGQSYVSALGETCVRITGHPSLGTACLRNNEWIGLTDIFHARPGQGILP